MNRTLINCTALVALVSCADISMAGPKWVEIVYTPISQCKEQVDNPNAAFSKLACKNVGKASLSIDIQSPQFFTLNLTQQGTTIHSEWDLLTKEGPMEAGKTLEWHVEGGVPKFLIFRLSYQTDYSAPKQEVLTVNWVSKERMCILATVNALKNPTANQQARELIEQKFKNITECPKQWLSI
jgi:hypothetical protein